MSISLTITTMTLYNQRSITETACLKVRSHISPCVSIVPVSAPHSPTIITSFFAFSIAIMAPPNKNSRTYRYRTEQSGQRIPFPYFFRMGDNMVKNFSNKGWRFFLIKFPDTRWWTIRRPIYRTTVIRTFPLLNRSCLIPTEKNENNVTFCILHVFILS